MIFQREFRPGDLVWFDPGVGYVLPGEVVEFHQAAQVITVQAVINNITKTFTLNNLSSVKSRQDLGANGVQDMLALTDLNEASVLWNLRIRYDNDDIYTYIGSILVSVNPYRLFDMYGLDIVSRYEGEVMGQLPPHLFAVGAQAYMRMLAKNGENQVVTITGESGSGKTESTKLLLQYLAAVNKSASNVLTEQILEAAPLLESFGNAKTLRNDNSSRFGKYLEIVFKEGVISGSRITDFLLEKSRIVSHAPEERNYHAFYELLSGMHEEERQRYGLMSAEKYFYLNQGGSVRIDGKSDPEDYEALVSALQVLGFTAEERETIWKILASILHLGNIYFHRKQLRHGQEGVEIGSDVEIKWTAHLLQLNINGISKALVMKTSEVRGGEAVHVPLNIDQALDARDNIAKALYSSLFTWLVARLNKICSPKSSRKPHSRNNSSSSSLGQRYTISILDMFGFEDFPDNSFEQLCINYANEALQYQFNKHVFKLEQVEYAKEKLEWTPVAWNDNQGLLHLLAKKPVGILHLLDDESNFPKASDLSFLEKCHYNHALNELYSRPRMSSMEFGIRHYAGQVWYNVEGFLDKNRDTLRYEVMGLLIASRDKIISKMFQDLRNFQEASRTMKTSTSNLGQGHLVTMKPRQPTVAARFQESLQELLQTLTHCHPFYVRCIKPNHDKLAGKFDMPLVLEQLRYTGMLETIRIRKAGFPVRMKYLHFAQRYRCLLQGLVPRGIPTKELSRVILEHEGGSRSEDLYALGASKVFMREVLEKKLEKQRQDIMEVEVVKVQRFVRGYLARKRYYTMKSNATKIQAVYRGYAVRKEYSKIRKGVVQLQAIYRMRRQQSLYGEMKTELQRRRALEAEAREEQRKRQKRDGILRETSQERLVNGSANDDDRSLTNMSNRAVASVNHLEVPAELAFVLSKLDTWRPPSSEKSLAKVGGEVAQPKPKLYGKGMSKKKEKLPHDIDYYVFSKVANVYFKSHLWGMKREPIKTPFLSKSKESDYQESLAIFKLILRFMNDNSLGGMREKILADYIVNKGIQNEKLRDEIYCQLANQTWKNDNDENCERGWLLFSQCLSSFPPSRMLYKYLLKYVSDHGIDGYKNVCQGKLLAAGKLDPHTSRHFPPTVLEWRSNKKRVQMSLEAQCSDGHASRHSHVDSFTTAEEFAATVLADRGLPELSGWTISLEEGDTTAELNGGDFLLDAIGELELPPAFPTATSGQGKSYTSPFLVTVDRSRGQLPLIINTGPHNDPTVRQYRYSSSPPDRGVTKRQHRACSQDRLLEVGPDTALAKSALNERYFDEGGKGGKSRSLDNLLEESSTVNFGLSMNSKLNRRYTQSGQLGTANEAMSPEDLEMESISQRGGNVNKWDDVGLGLSKTPLNDRYFSQPDLEKSSTSPSKLITEQESRARSQGNLHMTRLDSEFAQMGLENEDPVLSGGKRGKKGGRLHGNPRYVKGQGRRGRGYDKSSAMSDTSEAPSVASHVRRVRVPSQASDVDQFLDDLFIPALDMGARGGATDDALSDAKSLAASMRGGGGGKKKQEDIEHIEIQTFSRQGSLKRQSVLLQVLDTASPCPSPTSALSEACTLLSALKGGKDKEDEDKDNKKEEGMGFQPVSPTPGMMSPPPMLMPTPVHSMNMGLAQNMNMSLISNPQSLTSPLLMPSSGPGPAVSTADAQPAMAFTYVPVPVYNMGGVALPGLQGGAPPMGPEDDKNPTAKDAFQPEPPSSGRKSSASVNQDDQVAQQMAYQQAFLQNAVAQNMQIQQQLMLQNQALTQLLNTSGGSGVLQAEPQQQQQHAMPTFEASAVSPGAVPQFQRKASMDQLLEAVSTGEMALRRQRQDGKEDDANIMPTLGDAAISMKQRSQSTPNTPKISTASAPEAPLMMMQGGNLMDPYSRARTVRIGKWRWPPPKEEMSVDAGAREASQEGFFEFKMRKMQERKLSQEARERELLMKPDQKGYKNEEGIDEERHFERDPEWLTEDDLKAFRREKERRQSDKKKKKSSKKSSSSSSSSSSDEDEMDAKSSPKKEKKKKKSRASESDSATKSSKSSSSSSSSSDSDEDEKAQRKREKRSPSSGSIGKLKLSSEMKEKLEAVTGGSHSASRKSSVRSELSDVAGGVQKLAENRKLLLEQKLGGAGKLKKWDTVEGVDAKAAAALVEIPTAPKVGSGPEVPVPPPPPPIEDLKKHLLRTQRVMAPLTVDVPKGTGKDGSETSSFYSPDGSLPEPPGPPAPIKPLPGSFEHQQSSGSLNKLERKPSVDTQKTEKYELEESSEFLQPVDAAPTMIEEDDYQTLEDIKTTLLPPHSNTHLAYFSKVPWRLRVRKEVFSPNETVQSPLGINLIFAQIVSDVFSPLCIRFTTDERTRMKTLLDEYDVDIKNVLDPRHKLSTKKNIIDMAKEMPTYFARLYPISSGSNKSTSDSQYLAISHSGVRLVRRVKTLPTDHLEASGSESVCSCCSSEEAEGAASSCCSECQKSAALKPVYELDEVLETYNYDDIGEVSTVKHNGLQMVMHTGGRVVVSTDKAGQIKDLLNQYIVESNSGQYDYVKALADFASRDESTLNFRKGEIIAVVPKHDAYTEKGWLYGIKDGHYGLFPSDFVERMSPQAIRREMRVISKLTQQQGDSKGRRKKGQGSEEDEERSGSSTDFEEELDPEEAEMERRMKRDRQRDKAYQQDSWDSTGRGGRPHLSDYDLRDDLSEISAEPSATVSDGKHPLLEFAMRYFREKEKFQAAMQQSTTSESDYPEKKSSKKSKKQKGHDRAAANRKDWTWKDQVEMVKWTDRMINHSLLGLEPSEVDKMALECFACVMRYMGDLPLLKNQHEVECVNILLNYCHKVEFLRDEVYCQIMKQTTNNKSAVRDSCQKGWRLFSIMAAYFSCSDLLQPFLFKYLETAAYDKRRAYHGTALVCLHNLRKTFKYGGRKNVPSIEEITAISAGRSSKRQIYRLPGGTERVINTKSTTVVENIIEELCKVIGVDASNEREEFSLYCIVEGETFTVPLAKEHYILDVTTELQRDGAIYYLIFCRSVWYYPLRLDNQLYNEVVFNQIAPDYLEGLLLVMPGEQIAQEFVYDIAKVAALLHRAADMDHKPTIKETKFLLPKPALSARDIKPPQWVNLVQSAWEEASQIKPAQAKAQVLQILSGWPLFGSSFFAVRRESPDPKDESNVGNAAGFSSEHILALNKNGVSFLDLITHETTLHYPFTEVISTRKVQTEDDTLFLDMKCGNLMQQRITRIQTEQANEIARLIRQYITIDQRLKGGNTPQINQEEK